MKAGKKISCVVGSCVLLFSSVAFSANQEEGKAAPFISCDKLSEPQIAAQVKNDFMHNRLPRWTDEKALVGKKAVAWVNSQDVTKTATGYEVPLTVRGSKKDLQYNVVVDCEKSTITYNPLK
ncbi:hypothetical protein REJ26_004434 [Providencia stuartii]|uniref:Uncharacterized protein n=1 Tax=Providencia stuartii TaxID=588 RepID=A0A1S1HUJ7_PROST|nr:MULTISPECIES: protein YebF [Providencia]MDV5224537.1 protein YebF [Providencia rettgeri]ELR5042113.1 hypothetical protein [Providencia stuartii]ELR5080307.1 hypothetical protein [Providencia stuartii]ELR5084557.1 hypothetical protein [Providencia stuartii]ELR5298473.1 hypothetical protein [Providencia stuartii]